LLAASLCSTTLGHRVLVLSFVFSEQQEFSSKSFELLS